MTPITNPTEDVSDTEYARGFVEHLDDRIAQLTNELDQLTELRRHVAEFQARTEKLDATRND